ncbi:uncharacterized protein LOC143227472 [Tachypleus tridentatus]|uniref:uncharacterized protein LOC143227472 n=1 Tax=Tachypleus tridentatus TaxID=6853 RepID=UPI003FCEEFED
MVVVGSFLLLRQQDQSIKEVTQCLLWNAMKNVSKETEVIEEETVFVKAENFTKFLDLQSPPSDTATGLKTAIEKHLRQFVWRTAKESSVFFQNVAGPGRNTSAGCNGLPDCGNGVPGGLSVHYQHNITTFRDYESNTLTHLTMLSQLLKQCSRAVIIFIAQISVKKPQESPSMRVHPRDMKEDDILKSELKL